MTILRELFSGKRRREILSGHNFQRFGTGIFHVAVYFKRSCRSGICGDIKRIFRTRSLIGEGNYVPCFAALLRFCGFAVFPFEALSVSVGADPYRRECARNAFFCGSKPTDAVLGLKSGNNRAVIHDFDCQKRTSAFDGDPILGIIRAVPAAGGKTCRNCGQRSK